MSTSIHWSEAKSAGMMVIVFVGTFRRWVQLLHVRQTVMDDFGDEVLVTVTK